MKTLTFDVAIIGGGPAGATLASLLARAGVSVALIDRDTFPRDKLCGEFLSYDALPVLESIALLDAIDEAGATKIRTCRLIGSRRTYTFEFPTDARGISRRTMDNLFFRHAVASGASGFEGWTASAIETSSDRGEVSLKRDDENVTISARVLCGAWGRWARFDRSLSRPFVSHHAHRFFGFKRHYSPLNQRSGPPPDTIDLHSFARGYLGVNWIEGTETNICGLVHETRLAGHKGGWPVFVEALRRESPTLDRLYASHEPSQPDFLSSEPVVFTPRSVVEDHVMLLGDAAGLIDPLAGNGMAMAIQSAALTAPLIGRFIAGGRSRDEMENTYVTQHGLLFSDRIRWSRRVAWLLCRPRLLDAAMALSLPTGIGRSLLERTRATTEQCDALVDGVRRLIG